MSDTIISEIPAVGPFGEPAAPHVLDQDRIWVTAGGQTVELAALTPEHRSNIASMLRRQAADAGISLESTTLMRRLRELEALDRDA